MDSSFEDKKVVTIVNAFQKTLNSSKRKAKKRLPADLNKLSNAANNDVVKKWCMIN